MKVARWGNSLAVRLPRELADELSLKEGDEIELRSVGARSFAVARDLRTEDVFAQMEALSRPLPPGYKFDRDEANER